MPDLSRLTEAQLRAIYAAVCQELAQRDHDDDLGQTLDANVRPMFEVTIFDFNERIAA